MQHGGWYPGYQLRLFLKAKASIPQRPVHEGVEVQGTVGKMQNPLNHYTYYSLSQYLAKLNDYTSLDVMNRMNDRRHHRVRWFNFIVNPLAVFIRMFFVLTGFRDGFRGLLLAVYSSFYKLLLLAKVWEYETAAQQDQQLPPVTSDVLSSLKRLS